MPYLSRENTRRVVLFIKAMSKGNVSGNQVPGKPALGNALFNAEYLI